MQCLPGIDYAQGDAVIIMDCDLQHPVSIIPENAQKLTKRVIRMFMPVVRIEMQSLD